MVSLPKILLIEDDRSIAGALAYALKSTYDVDVAASGTLALYKIDIDNYDIIILDLNLPDVPGLTICQEIRNRGHRTPILILSGEVKPLTKISLLDAGANDYLTKPFSLGEFKARLRVLLRSVAQQAELNLPKVLTVLGVTINRQTYTVSREGVTIILRRKEFDLLEYLLEHAGQVLSREAIARHVWHDSDERWTNTVTVHIKSLRDKIDRPFDQSLIQTIHGRGYKFEASPIVATLTK